MNTGKIIALLVTAVFILSSGAGYVYAGGKEEECGKAFKARMEERIEKIYKEINVTAEQRKKLEENKNKIHEDAKALHDRIKAKRDVIRAELQKTELNMAKITQTNNELKVLEVMMMDQRLAGILAVRKILSPEQFRKFSQKLEEGGKHFKEKQD
ncbi:MAG: periplasmic heavy metal sensor [Candidatus Omnitrophota bacterium]